MGMSRSASFQGAHQEHEATHHMGECPQREIQHDAAVTEEFLELGSGCRAVVCHELGLAAQVSWIQGSFLRRRWLSQFVGSCSFQKYQSLGGIAAIKLYRCVQCG